ncbi:hypothetical protein SLS56_009869 [Neofusicoccum ribis]|uniref:Ankyrin repeat protein n=1 Tax=Neofusicoccum ribis TaxID=45134 RepID=A0ABR3SGJ9_9PEZI
MSHDSALNSLHRNPSARKRLWQSVTQQNGSQPTKRGRKALEWPKKKERYLYLVVTETSVPIDRIPCLLWDDDFKPTPYQCREKFKKLSGGTTPDEHRLKNTAKTATTLENKKAYLRKQCKKWLKRENGSGSELPVNEETPSLCSSPSETPPATASSQGTPSDFTEPDWVLFSPASYDSLHFSFDGTVQATSNVPDPAYSKNPSEPSESWRQEMEKIQQKYPAGFFDYLKARASISFRSVRDSHGTAYTRWSGSSSRRPSATPQDLSTEAETSSFKSELMDLLRAVDRQKDPKYPEALRKALSGETARTTTGETPLHIAAAHGNVLACKVLLDLGADVYARNMSDEEPPTCTDMIKAAPHHNEYQNSRAPKSQKRNSLSSLLQLSRKSMIATDKTAQTVQASETPSHEPSFGYYHAELGSTAALGLSSDCSESFVSENEFVPGPAGQANASSTTPPEGTPSHNQMSYQVRMLYRNSLANFGEQAEAPRQDPHLQTVFEEHDGIPLSACEAFFNDHEISLENSDQHAATEERGTERRGDYEVELAWR